MDTLSRRTFLAGTALTLAGGVRPSFAQAVDMAAAKKEGKVVWYCSVPVATAQKVANMFEQQTGIKVELFRSGGSNILRRFQQEGDSGKVFVDVLTHSEPAAASAMTKKGLFVPFKATDFDKVPDAVKDPDGNHVAQRLNVMAIYVRDDLLPAADRPKTWTDLLNPKYKGKMVMADPSFSSLLVVIAGTLARANGWKYFEGLRKNDIMMVQSNQQVSDMIKRGERIDRGRRGRRLCRRRPPAGHEDLDAVSRGRHVRDRVAELGGQRLAQPERRQGVRRFHARPRRCRSCSRTNSSIPRAPTWPDRRAIRRSTSLKMFPIDYDYIEAESPRIRKRFAEVMQ